MPKRFVLTLTGPDRIGIVDRLTGLVLARGGNIETSRMARLGGEFAVLMLVSISEDRAPGLDDDMDTLAGEGYKVTTTPSERDLADSRAGWIPYRIEVEGADHEGIIHELSHHLSGLGINIESVDSETTPAPISGSPLFTMTARVIVPPTLAGRGWESGLEGLGGRLNLEIRLSPPEDQ